eukprot:tig00000704_g3322.t1
MAAVSPEQLSGLLRNPNGIRNICILAHVDHGKTTLSDSLISSNGIISAKLAGKVRYLDFRPDEQLRGITMKSCSISLMYSHNDKPFLVNLIDSPGHVDFCSEVSTAVRLSDGAVVLVDVLEGVCTQTQSVLRQAWMEGVRPCLMLNKVDRLITELMLTPVEAYTHVVRIIEHINALMSHLHTEEHFANLSKAAVKSAAMMERDGEIHESDVSADDELDDSLEFSPAKGNVIFGSAYDGWAFSIDQFAKLYASKLGFAERVLRRTLWGNYVFEPKSKTIFKRSKGNLKPMFAQFIFEPIWEVYRCAQSGDQGKLEKITKSLNLTVPARELQHSEPQVRLKAVMSRWLPVAPAVLAMAVAQLPSPLEAQVYRTAKLVVLKFATISSVPQCPPFAPLNLQSAAVVRVAMEPSDPSDMPKLKQGLRLLNQADPSISITLQETGEHVIAASGELHLEICVKDLRERFAKTAIEVSAPLVSFRETVAADSRSKPVQVKTANGACTITIRAAPLPGQIQRMIDDNIDLLKRTFDAKPGIFDLSSQGSPTDLHALEFAKKLKAAILGEEQNVRFDPSCVWAMGPRRVGPNFLQQQLQSEEERIKAERINEIEASIITGFQAATLAGPLCEEPMSGVSLIVESIEFSTESPSSDGTTQYGPFTGQVIAATKEACRQAFLASAPRLVEALFFCDIQSTGSALGNVYAVLSKRRARILKEDMKEGTPIFTVEALLPVVESFGFVDDLRKKTSGAASAQLHFSHWEALPQDPMQQDVSQEDEDDENEEGVNVARNYMNAVRRRKGLPVEEKIIQHAEKQRTLAKKV